MNRDMNLKKRRPHGNKRHRPGVKPYNDEYAKTRNP